MKRLTEEMVIARTKTSDLSAIKRLNCWGSDLTDVSLLRRMSSVEVLSLSINKIGSLADFQECGALRELYIRQNNIRDLNEVCYLRDLQHLRSLWLGENPCAVRDGYRLSVIRALPHLQKLDDVEVTPEEVSDATRRGKPLVHPDDQDDSDQRWVNRPSPDRSPVGHHDYSPERRQPSYEQETEPEFYEREESPDKRIYNSPTGQKSPPRQYEPEPRRTYSPEPADPPGTVYYDDNRRNYEQEAMRQIRPYQYDEYTNGDRYTATVPHQERDVRYRQTTDAGSDGSNHSHSGYELLQPHTRSARDRSDRCERAACNVNHRPPFHRRPVTRNSNILSAVLCLVKELDYPSLEVVEMAVRCRMDELED